MATVPRESMQKALAAVDEARERALSWVVAHIDQDGRPAGSEIKNGYYRVPWALAVGGRSDIAARVLTWVDAHALDAQGDLLPGSPQTAFVQSLATYPLSQIALGAWLVERFDIANRVLDCLVDDYYDAESGGVHSERPGARVTGRKDLINTAQMGLAALLAGRPELADANFRWIADLWEMQPHIPERLYTARVSEGLQTAIPEGQSSWAVYTDFFAPRQQYYNPGMAAAFLVDYAIARPERRGSALTLAADFLRLNAEGGELQFDWVENMQICKFGWGAARLLEITGDQQWESSVVRMAHWYANSQLPDGSWLPSRFLAPVPDTADAMGKTAEHLMHLVAVSRGLRSRLAD